MNAFIEIKSGARGAFEVYVDDVLIFSKLKLDRFPNDGEIVNLGLVGLKVINSSSSKLANDLAL